MKKQILNLAAISALLITSLGFVAAGVASNLKANIPFDFVVCNKSMPAGTYNISRASTPGLVHLGNYKQKASVSTITNAARSKTVVKGSRLDFRRYGNQYFLGAIWTDGQNTGQRVPVSSTEREAAENAKFLAGHTVEPEIVSVNCQ